MSLALIGLPDIWQSWIKGHTKHVQNNSVSQVGRALYGYVGFTAGADQLCKYIGLISCYRVDVYRHNRC